MRDIIKICMIYSIFCCFSVAIAAVENSFHFTMPQQEQRFQKLLSELRCVVCQNQSLAESNAPLALDLKKEVYAQIQSGFSDIEIKNYLITRYGEYILFDPRVTKVTFMLWLGPFLFLFGGLAIMLISIRKQSKTFTNRAE